MKPRKCSCSSVSQCEFATEFGIPASEAVDAEGAQRYRLVNASDPGSELVVTGEGEVYVIWFDGNPLLKQLLRTGDLIGALSDAPNARRVIYARAREESEPRRYKLKQCKARSAAWRRRSKGKT